MLECSTCFDILLRLVCPSCSDLFCCGKARKWFGPADILPAADGQAVCRMSVRCACLVRRLLLDVHTPCPVRLLFERKIVIFFSTVGSSVECSMWSHVCVSSRLCPVPVEPELRDVPGIRLTLQRPIPTHVVAVAVAQYVVIRWWWLTEVCSPFAVLPLVTERALAAGQKGECACCDNADGDGVHCYSFLDVRVKAGVH